MTKYSFSQFIASLSPHFIPVISSQFNREEYVSIDLSIHNKELEAVQASSSEAFEGYVKNYVAIHNAKVAYGGYNETRGIYRRSTHFNQEDPQTERNIHLGLDVWCDAGTAILAPVAGVIHSFKNNTNFGDYGPTIILQHTIKDTTFYTLYGHLSLSSIEDLQVGKEVKQGSVIAQLGDASINGDYAPHLHFQIIKDMQGSVGDYPGVSSQKNIKFYLENCPDPNLLLNI